MRLPSASRLQLARTCLGSAVLPQAGHVTEYASMGTGIHRFLERTNAVGRDAAIAEITDPDLRAVCEALDMTGLPVDPAAYAAEVSFAWSWRTGAGRELGRGLGRDYSGCQDDEVPGTTDVVALLGDDAVYVGDYKSGYGHVPPPETNDQLRFLALAAARAYGRRRAVVEIIRPREDGPAWRERAELDMFALAEVAEEMRALAERLTLLEGDVRPMVYVGVGGVEPVPPMQPPLTLGDHCKYCDAKESCPARKDLAMSLALAGETDLERRFQEALSPATARRAYDRWKAMQDLVKSIGEHLATYAATNPIDLGDGRVFELVETRKETLDGRVVWEVVSERYGEKAAWEAVKLAATKEALTDLARVEAQKAGAKITHVNKELLREVAGRGGLRVSTARYVKEHKRKGEG